MLPAQYTLEDSALIVWTAAKKGRECARNGFRGSAVAYMEGLRGIAHYKGPKSLLRVAHSAADDINRLLNVGFFAGTLGPHAGKI